MISTYGLTLADMWEVAMEKAIQGEPESLWLASAGDTDYPALARDVEADVAVIGAGVAGLTAALALKRAGHTVAVIEAARVGTGVTGHTTGKVTSLHRLAYTELARNHGTDTARIYGQANEAALEHIQRVVAEENIDCDLRLVANYTYAVTDDALELVRAEADLAARVGLPSSFTTDVPLPFPVKGAVRFDGQAQFHAVRYLQGLARAVEGDGSFVFEQTRALQIRDGTPGVVETEGGNVRARDIIVATNVPFGDEGVFDSRCYPHRSYIVAGRVDTPPQDATFISVDEPMRSILTVSVSGQNYVLVGGEGHRASEAGDDGRYGKLAAFARDGLGASEIAYRWSTQDSMPVDGLPYVGLMSADARHVYVITGLRKWGLTNGTAAALILTDVISGRENPWAAVFNSNRITPAASAGRLAEENTKAKTADLTGHFTLAPGEGTVIDVAGESTAVYKDPDGQVHSLSAICTHMGCTVEFNLDATTWDCPCHGSRFAADGTVIHGPATTRLPPGPEHLPESLI
ncbi:FAD-dependent oxidoreductase [Pseudarthrobacter sulfonivorans]|uniref:FAD-dependent oxidoreductase n=1 Tax=Pseudarthrobacter sulfonivorans TaxID=121292 RepID=UPI0028676EEF|nr:FAD-dependent oxidoreductase [Pseudarthrobacter sulfonivorans]MDR6416461.1 glycine/D-amino acid oxidase-like deaminating enzyme/nitrite reductase/ring-hydroxylating ferredoxin subunit [Pseudarthrobacter sulfonivorans]